MRMRARSYTTTASATTSRRFAAAGVPQSARNPYYREFNKYIYTTCAK